MNTRDWHKELITRCRGIGSQGWMPVHQLCDLVETLCDTLDEQARENGTLRAMLARELETSRRSRNDIGT